MAEPVTREALEALTKAELHDTYGADESLTKAQMVDAVLASQPVVPDVTPVGGLASEPPPPDAGKGETVLRVEFPYDSFRASDGTTVGEARPGVRANPSSAVPSARADSIIAEAAQSGVTITKVS